MDNNHIQVYKDEIRSLEEEIKMLAEEYECSQHGSMAYSDGEIRMDMKSFKGNLQEDLKHYESFPDLEAQLDLLESDLSFIMKLTGICFTYYSRQPVEKSGIKIAHKYRLSGNCQSVPFQVEFQLLEGNQSSKNISAVVSDLNIIIESEKHSDLSRLVSRFYLARDKYPLLHDHALFMSSLFGSTYICEQLFSRMKHMKSKIRTNASSEHPENLLRIAITSIEPDIDAFVSQIQCQISHLF